MKPREHVALSAFCSMGVGGPARYFAEARDVDSVVAALDWADARGLPVRILGGGSNLVVSDGGVDGLVVKMDLRGVDKRELGGVVELTAAAGEPWDAIVRLAVERGWAGIECLSGIPGLVGATPIQNVGAYGQDVSETVFSVRVLDRRRREVLSLEPSDCGFRYRDSRFKNAEPDRYAVLAVGFRLARGGAPTVRYRDVAQHLDERGIRSPSLADVRESVLEIRRGKSMVLDPADPNRRSCGSFFVNPIVSAAEVAEIERRAGSPMPSWPEPSGRVKLSAAWLIERSGFRRGHVDGAVGLSTRHALAIVCHDGARASDVAALARRIRDRVAERLGVKLAPEPVFWGSLGL